MPIVAKTVVSPFFDRFSPFSTVFAAELIRDSFGKSGVGRFSISSASLENGENRKNGEPSALIQRLEGPPCFSIILSVTSR
jgi:hypothetical protein